MTQIDACPRTFFNSSTQELRGSPFLRVYLVFSKTKRVLDNSNLAVSGSVYKEFVENHTGFTVPTNYNFGDHC